jgi:hypothetical protein
MNSPPRLLIVTPTLGQSELLDATVASVAALPVPVRHWLSAPATALPDLARRFPQTQVVADAGRAGGIYGALNAALAAAGEDWDWFTYINDDDALLPGFGGLAQRHCRANAEPVAYGDVALVGADGRAIARITVERNPARIGALLQAGISPLMQQGTLFRRDVVRALKGFDLRYRLCADLDFWLRAYAGGCPFRYYPELVAQFRLRGGQLSADTAATRREQDEIVRRHLPLPIPSWQKTLARWNYRAANLPRYWKRIRARGWHTSYALLDRGET